MIKVKMLKTTLGADETEEGVNLGVKEYVAGKVYEMGESLAKAFCHRLGVAECVAGSLKTPESDGKCCDPADENKNCGPAPENKAETKAPTQKESKAEAKARAKAEAKSKAESEAKAKATEKKDA